MNFIADIPRNYNILIPFLETKLKELSKNLKNPTFVWDEIKKTEKTLSEINNSTPRGKTLLAKLVGARLELLKVYLTTPNVARPVAQLRKRVRGLRKNNVCTSNAEMKTLPYLAVIITYNKIFLPRSLKENEVRRFLRIYHKAEAKKKNNEHKEPNTQSKNECKNANTESKKSQKKNKCSQNPYEQFMEKLQQSNRAKHMAIMDKNEASKKQKRSKIVTRSMTAATAVKNTSACHSIRSDNEEKIVETIATKVQKIGSDIIESKKVHQDQNTAIDDNVINTVQKTNLNVSINDTSSDSSTIKQITETVETGSVQEQSGTIDSTLTSGKKKKSKKSKKKKLDPEYSSGTTENPTAAVDPTLLSKTEQLITEALTYDLPYMNKAVEEIRKRINDKCLKQEHTDTLQRLVNMENDHRKYISAFCNYLQ